MPTDSSANQKEEVSEEPVVKRHRADEKEETSEVVVPETNAEKEEQQEGASEAHEENEEDEQPPTEPAREQRTEQAEEESKEDADEEKEESIHNNEENKEAETEKLEVAEKETEGESTKAEVVEEVKTDVVVAEQPQQETPADSYAFGDPITVDMFDAVMTEVENKQDKAEKPQTAQEKMQDRIHEFLTKFLKTLKREDLAKMGTQDVRKRMEKEFGVPSLKEYSKFIISTISQIGIAN